MGKFDKEIKGFLEQFPEPYRTQALKNFDPDYCPERKPKSKADALSLAFSWHRSPQGYYYWGDFHTQLTKEPMETQKQPRYATSLVDTAKEDKEIEFTHIIVTEEEESTHRREL